MSWEAVWKIILCAISSAGGIGIVIIAIIKFSASRIAEKLSQKYEMKLQKELEKYKSGLDNKIYISKTKFDVEFDLYRQLSKAFFEMVKAITIMIPAGYATYPADPNERKEYENELYEIASKATIVAQDILNSNIPFIPEEIYVKYEEIRKLCCEQLGVFEERWNAFYIATQEEKEKFSYDDYKRSREIQDKFKLLNMDVRNYLAKLDVID